MARNAALENGRLEEAILISFDIPDRHKTRRTAIYRFLNGRTDTKIVGGLPKTYRYPGLLDEGGSRLGQSVFVLPPTLASRLIQKLIESRVEYQQWQIFWRH